MLALRLSEAKERQRVNKLMADAETASALARTTRGAVQGYERILAEASTKAATATTVLNLRIQAEAAASKALGDFELSERNRPRPVSVMISSRTGRISVRQGFEPVAEDDVEIRDPKRPLGTFLFTATNWSGGSQTELDWSVIAVNEKGEWDNPRGTNEEAKKLPPLTDAMRAQAALDRIKIPANIIEIVSEVMKPGSSLIISDYDMARSETSKGTDFIVQMPEVVAKYKTPADIAKAKAKRNFARTGATRFAALGSTRFGDPRYGAPYNYTYYSPPRSVVKFVAKPSPARPSRRFKSSIPSYFGYSRYDDDD